MKMVALNGALRSEPQSDQVMKILLEAFSRKGWSTEAETLCEKSLSACVACDACWYRTPGLCAINDPGREIAGKIIRSDTVVLVTPVTFGGYSSLLKKAVDRTRPLLSPLLRSVEGKVGHTPRYPSYPKFLAIGLLPGPDAESERLFHDLVSRNSRMLHAPAGASAIVYAGQSDEELSRVADDLLAKAGI